MLEINEKNISWCMKMTYNSNFRAHSFIVTQTHPTWPALATSLTSTTAAVPSMLLCLATWLLGSSPTPKPPPCAQHSHCTMGASASPFPSGVCTIGTKSEKSPPPRPLWLLPLLALLHGTQPPDGYRPAEGLLPLPCLPLWTRTLQPVKASKMQGGLRV